MTKVLYLVFILSTKCALLPYDCLKYLFKKKRNNCFRIRIKLKSIL